MILFTLHNYLFCNRCLDLIDGNIFFQDTRLTNMMMSLHHILHVIITNLLTMQVNYYIYMFAWSYLKNSLLRIYFLWFWFNPLNVNDGKIRQNKTGQKCFMMKKSAYFITPINHFCSAAIELIIHTLMFLRPLNINLK